MKKRIIKSKFIYGFTIFFFIVFGTLFIPNNTQPFSYNIGTAHNIFVILMLLFSIVIIISLLNCERYSIKLINIYIGIVLIINLKSFLIVFLTNNFVYNNYIYKIDITIFLIFFLILLNKNKTNVKDDELDKIGKE